MFAGLTTAQLELLAPSLQRREFPRRTLILQQGDPGHCLHIVYSGQVRVFVASETGQEMTVDILSKGDVFGEMALLSNHPRSASVMALQKTQTLVLQRAEFHRYLRDCPEIGINILEVLTNRLRATTAYASELVFRDLHGRIGRVLLGLGERHGVTTDDGLEIDLSLTQSDLAALVGSTRESVNRTLGVYRDHGLISICGTRITIHRQDDLRRLTSRPPVLTV